MGDKWETSGKTQKPVVEHDFILIQQKDTKAVKNRDKYETEQNRTPPLRQTYDWRQITSETDEVQDRC